MWESPPVGQRSEEASGVAADDVDVVLRDEGSLERSNLRDVDGAPRALGKYRVVAQLGEGGAATVYLALTAGPAGVNKLLVVKVLKRQLASEPDFLRMFMDEARLSTRLNHPNIVQMIEVGSADGRYFTVMEYLEGKPLSHVLGARIPGINLTVHVHLIAEALGGFHYAHELADYDGTPLGVIHRDVSPQNLFVTYDGHCKLLDFGVAKMLWSNETEVGVMKGKPRYMAPEQVCGGSLDRRVDIFSAGVILWEAIVGRRMWAGKHDMAVLYAVSNGHIPSLREAAPDAPRELVRIVTKALAQDRDERYATALALQEDLEAYLRSTGEVVSPRAVGKILTQHFASDRAHIKTAIEAQLSAMGSNTSSSSFRVLSFQDRTPDFEEVPEDATPVTPPARRRRSLPDGPPTVEVASVTPPAIRATAPSIAPPSERPERGRRASLLGAVVVTAAAVCALTWWSRRGIEQLTATPPPAPSASAAESAPTALPSGALPLAPGAPGAAGTPGEVSVAGSVTITLLASPPAARLFLDGKPLPSNPFVGRFPKDDAPHVLRAEAAGYIPREARVTLVSDGFFETTLPHKGAPHSEPPPAPTPGAPKADGVPPPEAPAPAATPAAPGDLARPQPKKRAVDRDDPYAE
jgi:serine/threonine protein kinase